MASLSAQENNLENVIQELTIVLEMNRLYCRLALLTAQSTQTKVFHTICPLRYLPFNSLLSLHFTMMELIQHTKTINTNKVLKIKLH
jgi:PhoPQ-activated pathogenicity-related protein